MNTNEVLNERQNTHGDFTCNSRIAQELKATLLYENTDLTPIQREAIEMICHKLARVVCGNPDYIDVWRDISGYATLVADRLQTTSGAIDSKVEYYKVP